MSNQNAPSTNKSTRVSEAASFPRRSFLRAVATGLIAFIPAAAALLNAPPAIARETCEQVRCAYRGWYQCVCNVLQLCEEEVCYDYYNMTIICWGYTHCTNIGCC